MNGKILTSLLVIGLTIVLVGGATFANFSDTEESTGNTFAAGTLDLGLANTEGTDPNGSVTGTWKVDDWKPCSNVSGTLFVNNAGTLDASSVMVNFSAIFTEGTPLTVDPGTSTLGESIIATTVQWDGEDVLALEDLTLDELIALEPHNLGPLAANTEKPLYILWTFDHDADNGVQGDSVNVTLSVTLLCQDT